MRLRIVNRIFPDGIARDILESRCHWWNKWKPLCKGKEVACVTYQGSSSCKTVDEECFEKLELDAAQRQVRDAMLGYVLRADEIYVGARIGNDLYVGHDVVSDESLNTLRNLRE